MHYQQPRNLNHEKFRRFTGVSPKVFSLMLGVLILEYENKHVLGGAQPKLCVEDQLLMAISYWREYRTYFHLGNSYGVSESSCFRVVQWVENTLISNKRFRLPGKKSLLEKEREIAAVLVDVTETPCERPKKNRGDTTLGRRSATH
jgi:Helix-turn-helix of DDE superfamily endonuclease